MSRTNRPGLKAKVIVIAMAIAGCTAVVLGHSLPPMVLGVTGDPAFSESSCNQSACHFGNPVNAAGGSLVISGAPQSYELGKSYPITITLNKAGQKRWGFEFSARVESSGKQAGTIVVTDSFRTQVDVKPENGVQYIHHSVSGLQGTFPGSNGPQSWTFTWQAPAADVGIVRFSSAGNAANNDSQQTGDFIYTAFQSANPPQAAPAVTTYFADAVIGGGFSTVITLTNTGAATAAGNLFLTDQKGAALLATFAEGGPGAAAPSGKDPIPAAASQIAVSVPAGGTTIVTVSAPERTSAVSGWARVVTDGGTIGGVATFQFSDSTGLKTIAGVLAAAPTASATIPVDNSDAGGRYTGFAVANINAEPVTIRLYILDRDGVIKGTKDLDVLPAQSQIATFLHQVAPEYLDFRGSMVLASQAGKLISVTALLLNKGLFTAIPAIPQKPPGVP